MSSISNLAVLVAASENNVIGVDDGLPWHISADLRRFKKLTMGHAIIMGRKTFESIGRCLPGRKTIIITRQSDYSFGDVDLSDAIVVSSIEEALAACADDSCPFIVGGAQIYELAMPFVNRIFLTRVHTVINGDTKLPEIKWETWTLESAERFESDEKNEYDYSFENYRRN